MITVLRLKSVVTAARRDLHRIRENRLNIYKDSVPRKINHDVAVIPFIEGCIPHSLVRRGRLTRFENSKYAGKSSCLTMRKRLRSLRGLAW